MAEAEFKWSESTYRLDEIAYKQFQLPLLIQLTEGIHTDNEVDSFSADDILTIDRCVTLQKVAAQFAGNYTEMGSGDYEILKEEILIPLNYKGKLKVVNEPNIYHNVRDLARDFPRFAKVLEMLSVETEHGLKKIVAGSVIELDRVLPGGQKTGNVTVPYRLVVSTESGGRGQVALPFEKRCRFRSTQDSNEYTLRDLVDRYSLPQVIRFLDNEIQEIYTRNLIEGVEQMTNVTGPPSECQIGWIQIKTDILWSSSGFKLFAKGYWQTTKLSTGMQRVITASDLRIKTLVQQRVMIGHYTNADERRDEHRDTKERYCRRTLVVIPYETPDIAEICVRVYEGDEDSPDYEEYLVENIGTEMAEGLYVEFLKKPRIIRLNEGEVEAGVGGDRSENEIVDEPSDEPPPPVPPRAGPRGRSLPLIKPKPKQLTAAKHESSTDENKPPKTAPRPQKQNEYFRMESKEQKREVKSTSDKLKDNGHAFDEPPKVTPKPPKQEESLRMESNDQKGDVKPLSDMLKDDDDTSGGNYGRPLLLQTMDGNKNPMVIPRKRMRHKQAENYEDMDMTISPRKPIHSPYDYPPKRSITLPRTERTSLPSLASTLADISFIEGTLQKDKTKGKFQKALQKLPGMFRGRKQSAEKNLEHRYDNNNPDGHDEEESDGERLYDEPDDSLLDYNEPQSPSTTVKGAALIKDAMITTSVVDPNRPVAQIRPQTNMNKPAPQVKAFRTLNKEELTQRLVRCGMPELATFCAEENLDGEFLFRMDNKTFKSLGLSGFNELKLKQIIAGWIPSL